jgi:hypothetical protein
VSSDVIVTSLQTCLQLVKKKLNSGTQTGEILDAVIAGEDGPINEKAKAGLARLQSLARLSKNNSDTKYIKICWHCEKIETQEDSALLMKCQRCKTAYYCSKDCQAADWKIHKKTCKQFSSGVVSRSEQKTSDAIMSSFVESNYFIIAKEVYKKTQEYNVPKKELLVEIDFFGDAPALRNEFKVCLTSGFLEVSSVADVPDWFRTDAAKKSVARYLREDYERVTCDDMLTFSHSGNDVVNVQTLCFPVGNVGYKSLFDEAVESIGREDYVRMVACLGQSITNQCFEQRSGLV